jgi:outer membrane protein TolC
MWQFERFKHTFAVSVARQYFGVLRQMDAVGNAADNYESAVKSARWSRRRGDAGRIRETEVDQAVQRELTARNGWISAQEQLKGQLDSSAAIGLPTDARIELTGPTSQLQTVPRRAPDQASGERDGDRRPPTRRWCWYRPAGRRAGNSMTVWRSRRWPSPDLRSANAVFDAQRAVVVAADALGTELTLGGSAVFAENDDDGTLSLQGGRYAALLSLDLPIERTRERNAYRNSLIDLERATRDVQNLEDDIG